MLNVYLFIELLGSADSNAVIDKLKKVDFGPGTLKNAVALNAEKIVAQIDGENSDVAIAGIVDKVSQVDGVVQTNIVAVVRPRDG